MRRGDADQGLFVFAESLLAIDHLRDEVRVALADKRRNLGRIPRGNRPETLRG